MEEELIKYNTAKLADEKGFRIGCKYAINEDNEVNSSDEYTGDPYFTHEETIEATDNTEVPHYLCPTQSLLQKWLRDEHNIDIQVICNHSEKLGKHYLLGIIYIINNQVESFIIKETDVNIDYINKMYVTYEEALENGLYESLNLIK